MSAPTFPVACPTVSFWLGQARGSSLLSYRSTAELPTCADIVVVGAGYTGAVVVNTLLEEKLHSAEGIMLLEARDVSSGATGRNGGHTRPDRFVEYSNFKKQFGKEQALKLIKDELANYEETKRLIRNVDCDAHYSRSFIFWEAEEQGNSLRGMYDEYIEDGGDGSDIHWVSDPETAAKLTRVPKALGAVSWPAGTLFPFKIVESLITKALEQGVTLQTNTLVTSITPDSSSGSSDVPRWVVHTERGDIVTPKVIHATNAYSSALLPSSFKDEITPYISQCSAHIPPLSFSGPNKSLKDSIVILRLDGSFDYFMQRPKDGAFILGGNSVFGGNKTARDAEFKGRFDDGMVSQKTKQASETFFSELFGGEWNPKATGEGQRDVWTGVMGYTLDGVPLVGELPGLKGQFTCVGYQGHGMSRIPTAARGLARLVAGQSWEETGLPECLQISQARLTR